MVIAYVLGLVILLFLGKGLFDSRDQKRPLRLVWAAPLIVGLGLMLVGAALPADFWLRLGVYGAGMLLFLGGMVAYVAVPRAKR